MDTGRHYRFGQWHFNANTGDLADAQSTTRLEPQVGKLLEYFLGHQEQVISRDELIAHVWDNRVVSDDAINRCISILRQLLSPDDKSAYIETVIRRGYIAHFPPAPEARRGSMRFSGRRKYLALALLGTLAVVGILLLIGQSKQTPPKRFGASREGPPVVAVLPFSTSHEESDGAFFAEGVHDDLLTQLAQLQALRVISRTSVLGYRYSEKNLREIGRELGADAILEGRVQTVDDQIRINVQLIDASSDEHLWAQTFDRELSPKSLFAMQSEISRAIAGAMQTTLTERETSQLSALPTDNMAAYRAYHGAMKIRDSDSVHSPEYLDNLERAVALDPDFVRAWAELAGLLSFEYFSHPDPALIERVETILEQIQSLAPESAEFLVAQAYYTYYILRDYDPAYQLISQAHALRPGDVRVLELKSWIERRLGDYEGKIKSVRLARAMDPLNPLWQRTLVWSLVTYHRYDEADREIDNAAVHDYSLGIVKRTLQVRQHRNFDRWATDMAALQEEFEENANPLYLWDALVAARQFAAAEALVRSMPADQERITGTTLGDLDDKDLHRILTDWLLQKTDSLREVPPRLQNNAQRDLAFVGTGRATDSILVSALRAAVAGDTRETEQKLRRWRREIANDLAHLSAQRHFSCRVLGMAAAAAAAAECIRDALEEPSGVMPFIEPHLPWYDPVREQPEFMQLLANLESP
ncbi:winged helix-turn-helix domain-containing protein [Elongatibacter sediminis]|uniref:Winged helix-turn-helix domain-containing protein n=1 Tax=Elongatibacter sediminis TaxID=3119006 RepID=A0AAW9R6N6_9GAMM